MGNTFLDRAIVCTGDPFKESGMDRFQFVELVGQAIGEASTCWHDFNEKPPGGAFDSERASAIVDRIVEAAEAWKAHKDDSDGV